MQRNNHKYLIYTYPLQGKVRVCSLTFCSCTHTRLFSSLRCLSYRPKTESTCWERETPEETQSAELLQQLIARLSIVHNHGKQVIGLMMRCAMLVVFSITVLPVDQVWCAHQSFWSLLIPSHGEQFGLYAWVCHLEPAQGGYPVQLSLGLGER